MELKEIEDLKRNKYRNMVRKEVRTSFHPYTIVHSSLISKHRSTHFPMRPGVSEQTNEHRGVRERSEHCRPSEGVSGASKQANGRASEWLSTADQAKE